MDKANRLKLYSEKDYTENIDFPVELIGRDGVVRRYSFADSVRIYERRIESAHIRYTDREIINAEISHCSRRLEQIQRSWKQRIRHCERQYIKERSGPKDRELYSRGKRFLRRYFERIARGAGVFGELQEPNLVVLEEARDFQIFYVNWPVFYTGTLLYVYRLSGDESERMRDDYLNYQALVARMSQGPDTEKLVHHEARADMAFILTSPRADPVVKSRDSFHAVMIRILGFDNPQIGESNWIEGLLNRAEPAEEGPYRQGLDELRWSDFEGAFDHFREALEENPYHKEAYWALGEIADILGRWAESEPYLVMALKYFPAEPKAHFYFGQVLLNRESIEEAEEAFARAVEMDLGQARGFGFLACAQALCGRYKKAAGTIERGLEAFPKDRASMRLAQSLERALSWRRRLVMAVGFFVLCCSATLLWGVDGLFSWGLLGIFAAVLGAAYWRSQRKIRRHLWAWTRPRSE